MNSDDDLRHDHEFVNDTEAVIRLGSMLLSSGTGSYRVKRAMTDTGDALGMDRLDATVGLTEITVTAHRGASTVAPENTLAAFQAAIDAGADAIEFDVRLSADGAVVVGVDQCRHVRVPVREEAAW